MRADKKTRFKIDNREAAIHSMEEWQNIFEDVYKKAKGGKYLRLAEAFMDSDVKPSTYKWLVNKDPVLATIKEDIKEAIANKINKKGLNGDFNPAMSIWRLKQLGEEDVTKTDVTTKGKEINNTPIINFVNTDD